MLPFFSSDDDDDATSAHQRTNLFPSGRTFNQHSSTNAYLTLYRNVRVYIVHFLRAMVSCSLGERWINASNLVQLMSDCAATAMYNFQVDCVTLVVVHIFAIQYSKKRIETLVAYTTVAYTTDSVNRYISVWSTSHALIHTLLSRCSAFMSL